MSDQSVSEQVIRGPVQRTAGQPVVVFKPFLLGYIGQPCPYCGVKMADRGGHMVSRDHILPRFRLKQMAQRERYHHFNRIIVGSRCNHLKDAMTLFDFAQLQPSGSARDIALQALLARLRTELPYDVFIDLTGSPR